MITYKILDSLDLIEIVEGDKLACFLDKIFLRYRRDVQYHNDLHAVDVTQMMYRMLTRGYLSQILNLNSLDLLSAIIAAVCHDVGHDGLNNAYHSNAVTKRAIDSNDMSVQESYHAAETFRQLNDVCSNFTENMNKQESKLFSDRISEH